MPIYKDEKYNTWFCKFYYVDYNGQKKQKLKRGFKTKREAKEFENRFLVKHQKDVTMPFSSLVKYYKEDMETRLKPATIYTKQNIIDKLILPYFNDMPLNNITPSTIRTWQNELIQNDKNYSQTYLRTVHTLLVAIFNFAMKYYDLKENPCSICGSIGSMKTEKEMTIWTLDQFKTFIEAEKDNIMYYTAFNVLFYTGLRIGELLALTWGDIDFDNQTISINKSLQVLNGVTYITSPKTRKSIRTITIFPNLVRILQDYKSACYEPLNDSRLFPIAKSKVLRELRKKAKAQELPQIRLHDLRHSHASLLIELGFSPLAIADRLGHESVQTTLNVYSHLYPNKQDELAQKLQEIS